MIEAENLRIENGRTLFNVGNSVYQVNSMTSRDANKLDFIERTIGLDAIKVHALFESLAGSGITFKTILDIEALTCDSENVRIECLVSLLT